MSPREKRYIAIISLVFTAVVIFGLVLYYIPTFLYITFILVICCAGCYYQSGVSLYDRLGPRPRRGLTIPPVLRRWFHGRTANGVATAGRLRSRSIKSDIRESVAFAGQSPVDNSLFRRDVRQSDLVFSPRDILMGSYIGKAESPAVVGRPMGAGSSAANPNPRDQLRGRLARPNHAVYTPNRRLTFGEPLGNMSRFTITPQRHYPLQQTGTSSVGILPPPQWDSFRKKNILTPRNSAAVHSPVTVKIARPDHHSHRSPFYDHLNSPGGLGSPGLPAPADPCSRETVLSVLKDSRKREVEEEDERSFIGGQKSKRRRNDSGGSAHSAFEPLLPNGAPSQLVPKPGTLKRGLNPAAEESTMKRSRTSSISSVSCGQTPSGILGSARNPIRSSYSSSQGFSQRKKASTRSLSPLSSPGSSRSQTPERASKKPREEDVLSPSSASSVRSDKTTTDPAPTTGSLTPAPEVPVAVSLSDSASSGGKRKRKIQLVSSRRGDQISLPPPPELGYTVTVKDLDQEKKAALSQIQKVLEEPAPEPERPAPAPAVTLSSPPALSADATPTLSSLLAAPLPTESAPASMAAPIPVINLDPSASTAPTTSAAPASNPLLESLKMMRSSAASTAPSVSVVTSVATPAEPSGATSKPDTASATSAPPPASLSFPPPASLPQPSPAPLPQPVSTGPSAFTQVLSQAAKAPASAPTLGRGLFGLANPLAAPSFSTAPSTSLPTATPASTAPSASSSNPLLASVFKPIFGATTTAPALATSVAPESKPSSSSTTFKPVFGSATSSNGAFGLPFSTAPATAPSSSVFGGLAGGSAAGPASSLFGGPSGGSAAAPPVAAPPASTDPAAQASVKSLFGSWNATPATTAAPAPPPPSTGSTFQFGAAAATTATLAPALSSAATTAAGNNAFTFGAMTTTASAAPAAPPAQANPQGGFTFGQAAPSQNSAPGPFGGFGMAAVTATTTAPATQSTFAFGKSSFDAPAAPAFPSTTQPAPTAATKPFAFGGGGAGAGVPAAAAAPAPFAFGGAAATTTASTFGTPAKPAFGAASSGFAFGGTTTPSVTPAAPAFGGAAGHAPGTLPPPASTFAFGGGMGAQQNPAPPAQTAGGGFNFGAAISAPQFGTPVSNNPNTQTPGFNFGSATASDKPAFGTSTPAFGQSAAAGPIPFGSPGASVQGFSALAPSPFGSPSTPSFSIGAGSKPSGARQRLQARRQHPRKK